MESDELGRFQIAGIGEEARNRFMEWHHLPIVDGHVPCERFELEWPQASSSLRALLEGGNRVFVHCLGGLGRAGSVCARLLVEMGEDPEAAIGQVRAIRSRYAIETKGQADWVRRGRTVPVRPHALNARDRAVGALVGLAVGDAVGTALEFSAKPSRPIIDDMVGGGPFGLAAGQWTDDTAMALALADSLLVAPHLDAMDLMRRFVSWYSEGTYSCTGDCFDIGIATRAALARFMRDGNPIAGSVDPQASGNGALMRLAPVAIRHWRNREELLRVAELQTQTTHGSPATVEACEIFSEMLADTISGMPLTQVLTGPAASQIVGGFAARPRSVISGSGYVVHSIQAAVWAVSRTTSFRSAILLAANLGEDADTTAAIAGQLAGAAYGVSGIPEEWLEKLAWRERLEAAALELFEQGALS